MPSNELARYTAESGNEITLTEDVVRNLISTDPNVTKREIDSFVALCKAHKLDPFIKEAYLIKYGSKPATIVVGKDTFTKRAFRNPKFQGFQAGVMVINNGKGHEREGSLVLDGETLVGGWAKVYIDGYKTPFYDSVSFREYNTSKSNWASKPGTMIRKVALVHALREAFPDDFGGLYDSAEMGIDAPQEVAAHVEQPSAPAEIYEEFPGAYVTEVENTEYEEGEVL